MCIEVFESFLLTLFRSYIGLIRLQSEEAAVASNSPAKQFWDSWHRDFMDYFSDELLSLSSLTNGSQLSAQDFLTANNFM